MKLIKKYQDGGSPFMVYTPIPSSTPVTQPAGDGGQAPKDSGGDSKDKISKEVTKALLEGGLPSDVDVFLDELQSFGMSIGTSDIDDIMSTPQGYKMIVSQITKLKYNKNFVTKAQEELYSKRALEEAALTPTGGVIAYTEDGKITPITIEEYGNNRDKYRLITNNELLQLRAYDRNMAFNNSVSSILANGEGTDHITEQLQAVINQMKVEKMTKEDLLSNQQIAVLKGIEAYEGGITKVTESYSTSRKYKDYAIEYLYSTLSASAKSLLKVKAVEKGLNPEEGARLVMELLIFPSTEENVDMKLGATKGDLGDGTSGGGGKDKETSPDFKTAVLYGQFKSADVSIQPGDEYAFKGRANLIYNSYDTEGKAVKEGTSIATMVTDVYGGIIDQNSASFGDQRVPTENLNRIAYTGNTSQVVSLPYRLENGSKVVDFGILEDIKEANKKIVKEYGENATPQQKMEIYKKMNLEKYVVSNASQNPDIFARFVGIPAVAYDEGVVNDKNTATLVKLPESWLGNDQTAPERLIKKAYTGQEDGDLDYTSTWTNDQIYSGMIYFNMIEDLTDPAITGKVLKVSTENIESATKRKADLTGLNQAVTGSDILNTPNTKK